VKNLAQKISLLEAKIEQSSIKPDAQHGHNET
jgi:hypothetical protein